MLRCSTNTNVVHFSEIFNHGMVIKRRIRD